MPLFNMEEKIDIKIVLWLWRVQTMKYQIKWTQVILISGAVLIKLLQSIRSLH